MDTELSFFINQAKSDLLAFCAFTDSNFETSPKHLQLITQKLKALDEGKIQNLIISMPPRAGKSRIMQEYIAKLFGDNPAISVLYTGHSLNLLQGFSRNIRNRIQSNEYKTLYDTRIASDSSAVNNWNIEDGGEFAIYGVGGGITGKGGDLLIIDDPYATRQDAESETIRRTVSDWYWSTFLSRKQNDKTKQIIIMQRWREDDLVGEILEREGEKWEEVKIPALDEKGESFWETKFSKEYFEDIQRNNPIFFQSQYQQDPISPDGQDFKRDFFVYENRQKIEERIHKMNIVTFLDPAISQKQEADFTAIVTIGQDTETNLYYLLEVKQLKALPDEIIGELFSTVLEYSNKGYSYKAGIEVVQYQKMLALAITDEMRKRNQFFYLEEMRPSGEKEARIRSILQPLYASHQIIHEDIPTIRELENELLKFPNGKHDDLIDAMASGISLIQSTSSFATPNNTIISPTYI